MSDFKITTTEIRNWLSFIVPIIMGFSFFWYSTKSQIEINSLKIKGLEIQVNSMQNEYKKLHEVIYEMKYDMNQGFNDLKLELKDKADRSHVK
jgi:hypothetical protein